MSQRMLSPPILSDAVTEVDIDSFRAAMRELAGGVVVVTVGKDQDITGFTATSFASLSAHPPRLLVCVNKKLRFLARASATSPFRGEHLAG
jgi:flavin reductase (DIM6/NTAB) family NADH-FMN oxidoreductase RutF